MNSLCDLLASRFLEHKINPMKLLQGNLTSHLFFFFLDESFIFKIGMAKKNKDRNGIMTHKLLADSGKSAFMN